MKKLILPITAISLLSLESCKKENSTAPNLTQQSTAKKKMSTIAMTGISVSQQGFLKFASRENFGQYVHFLATNTLDDVQTYDASIGFKSLNGTSSSADQNALLRPEQQMGFLLNADGIVQIENTLMKPIENGKAMLTMQISNVTNGSYGKFKMGIYDASVMNKFSAQVQTNNHNSLLDIVGTTPSGIDEVPGQTLPAQEMGWHYYYIEIDRDHDGIVDQRIWFREYCILGIPVWSNGEPIQMDNI